MQTEELTSLSINRMSQEQFDQENVAGRVNPDEFYLTPDDLIYATETFVRDYVEEAISQIEIPEGGGGDGKVEEDIVQYLIYQKIDNIITITGYKEGIPSSVTIPDVIEGLLVTKIGEGAFNACTAMEQLTIPTYVETIGNLAFNNCTSLKFVNYNALNCTVAGDSNNTIFTGCTNLTNATIGSNVQNIPAYLFKNCQKLNNIDIPNSVTSIGNQAFMKCESFTNIVIPNSITQLNAGLLNGCQQLQYIHLPSNLTSIGNAVFKDCIILQTIAIPDSVASIRSSVFANCTNLAKLSIPNGVDTISQSMLFQCSSLTSIAIPASVTKIETQAFYLCDNLKDIYYEGSESEWQAITIVGDYNTAIQNATKHYNQGLVTKEYVDETIKGIETSLDSIIALQNSLINGDSV